MSTAAYNTRGVWSEAEHDRFLKAMQLFPNGPWRAVAEHVGTRSVRQVQTHAQKYHEKVARRLRGLRKDRKRLQRPEHRIDDEMLEICKALQRDPVVQKPKLTTATSTPPPVTQAQGTPYHRRSRSMMEWKDLKQVQATLVKTQQDAALSELTEVEHEDSVGGPVPMPPFNDCLDFLIDYFNEPPRSMPTPRFTASESVELSDPELDLDHLQLATSMTPNVANGTPAARPKLARKSSM